MATHRSILDSAQIDEIEGRLAGTLRPVTPPEEFVRRLRNHVRLPENSAIALRLRDWQRLFMVFGGVLSGAVVILTVARAMYHLFGRRNG